jgi:hypothetical protein
VTCKSAIEKQEHAPRFTFKLAGRHNSTKAAASPTARAFYDGLKQADPADIIADLRTVPPLQ